MKQLKLNATQRRLNGRIYGGRETRLDEFPWVVYINITKILGVYCQNLPLDLRSNIIFFIIVYFSQWHPRLLCWQFDQFTLGAFGRTLFR